MIYVKSGQCFLCNMSIYKILLNYSKHFFVETAKANHLIRTISEAKWIQDYLGNFGCINENWLPLWRWHFFHPYDLVLISELSKRSKLYHFNVLKCNFCFIMNIWQKFKSSISVFKPWQCCRGAIYCFSLTSKQTIIIDLWKK